MKRRNFIKGLCTLGAATAVPASALTGLTACSSAQTADNKPNDTYNFDEEVDRSGTWSIKFKRGEESDPHKLSMWIADMDFKTDPYIAQAMEERLKRDVMGYTYIPDEYYDAICGWLKSQQHWEVERDWVSYCPGVITSMNMAYEVFSNPGDKIIVQPPVYDHFRLYIEKLGRTAVDNPLIYENGKFRMNLEQLESLIDEKTKMLVLCNPQNPGGIAWDKEQLQKLAEICCRHHVIVVSDEIHADLTYDDHTFVPFCSVSDEARQIGLTFEGPTKTFNLAGLTYTAFCVIPNEELRKSYLDFLDCHKMDEAPVMSVIATIAGYTHPTNWLTQLKTYLKGNIDYLVDFMGKEIPQIKPIVPQSSFLVFLDCKALNMKQEDLVNLFNEKAGVVISNGASYGQGGEGFIRINIGCTRKKLTKALQQLKEAVDHTFTRT